MSDLSQVVQQKDSFRLVPWDSWNNPCLTRGFGLLTSCPEKARDGHRMQCCLSESNRDVSGTLCTFFCDFMRCRWNENSD